MRSPETRGGLTIGSLFSGIGGFDLAAEYYGWRTSWFVEWDAHCQAWLAEQFPGRPIYGDITQVDFSHVEAVDILCGGFPCQPASAAGKRLGTADDRWLWPEFARAIRTLRPRYVVAENVSGLLSVNGGRAFAEVLRDLAELGYDAEWRRLSAADVGAPHERERVWLVAYTQGDVGGREQQARGAGSGRAGLAGVGAVVGHANVEFGREQQPLASGDGARPRGESRRSGDAMGDTNRERGCGGAARLEDATDARAPGEGVRFAGTLGWRDATPVRGADGTVRLIPREAADAGPESPLWPVANGVPGRVARLRAIGNTVVPACVIEGPFQVIAEIEAALTPPQAIHGEAA